MTPVKAPAGRESIFDRIADYVSAAMGRPANIMIWLVLVVGWTSLFAAHIVSANANFLPGWFSGTAFNFPLNLVTRVRRAVYRISGGGRSEPVRAEP
jgi:hypothetical protein